MAATSKPVAHKRPNLMTMALHLVKTFSLTGALLGDERVHPARKIMFVAILGAFIAAALGVDGVGEILTQLLNIIPGAGVLLGIGEIPVDAGVDWLLVSVVAFNLLKLFPASIVGEHYDRLFRRGKNNA